MIRRMLIIVGVVSLIWAGYAVYANRSGQGDNQSQNFEASQSEADRRATISDDALSENRTRRIVGEYLISVPQFEVTELERLPPRAPLSKLDKPGKRKRSGIRLLHQPLATAAGIFEARGIRIQLAGIIPILPDVTCKTSTSRRRPCGKMALTAFRAWLRGRAIECDLGHDNVSDPVEATCTLGGKDAAAWLVRHGWARALTDGRYAELERTAQSAALGIFASDD